MRLYDVQRLPVADRVVRARGVERRGKVDAEEVQHANERRRAAAVHSSDDNGGPTQFRFVGSPLLVARSEFALEIHELGQRLTLPVETAWRVPETTLRVTAPASLKVRRRSHGCVPRAPLHENTQGHRTAAIHSGLGRARRASSEPARYRRSRSQDGQDTAQTACARVSRRSSASWRPVTTRPSSDRLEKQQVCPRGVDGAPDRPLGDAQALTLDRREEVIDGAVLGWGLDLDSLRAVPEEVALRQEIDRKQQPPARLEPLRNQAQRSPRARPRSYGRARSPSRRGRTAAPAHARRASRGRSWMRASTTE